MFTDSGLLAKALENARKLYKCDMITCPFDLSLEAEACGCEIAWENDHNSPSVCRHVSWKDDLEEIEPSTFSRRGRMPVVLDAFRRLKIVVGKEVHLAAAIAGPLTLAEVLSNSDIVSGLREDPHGMRKFLTYAARIALTSCKAFLEAGADIIIIIDGLLHRIPEEHLTAARSLFGPIFNTIRFYNASSVLMTNIEQGKKLDVIFKLNADGVILNCRASHNFQQVVETARGKGAILGIAVPSQILTASETEITQFLLECFGANTYKKVFLTTDWEVPLDADPEKIHLLSKCIAGHSW
jgi:uroporphyrinogen decarboxylase